MHPDRCRRAWGRGLQAHINTGKRIATRAPGNLTGLGSTTGFHTIALNSPLGLGLGAADLREVLTQILKGERCPPRPSH